MTTPTLPSIDLLQDAISTLALPASLDLPVPPPLVLTSATPLSLPEESQARASLLVLNSLPWPVRGLSGDILIGNELAGSFSDLTLLPAPFPTTVDTPFQTPPRTGDLDLEVKLRWFGAEVVRRTGRLTVTPRDPTIPPPPPAPTGLRHISLSGLNSVVVFQSIQITAFGVYNDGTVEDISASVLWVSSNPLVAIIGQGNTGGLLAGVAEGVVQVSCSIGLIQSLTTEVTVTPAPPPPPPTPLEVAVALPAGWGTTTPDQQDTYVHQQLALLGISNYTLVYYFPDAGQLLIGYLEGGSGGPPPPPPPPSGPPTVSITSHGSSTTITDFESLLVTATALSYSGQDLTGSIQWLVDSIFVGSFGGSFYTNLAVGSHVVTARVTDGGLMTMDSLSVTVTSSTVAPLYDIGDVVSVPRTPPRQETISEMRWDSYYLYWSVKTVESPAIWWQESLVSAAFVQPTGPTSLSFPVPTLPGGEAGIPLSNPADAATQIRAKLEEAGQNLGEFYQNITGLEPGVLVHWHVTVPIQNRTHHLVVTVEDVFSGIKWVRESFDFLR